MKNYYKVLGINEQATLDEIKKAYKQLAILYHPDKNKDSSAIQMFKDISDAYQVLSNSNKKDEYDNSLRFKNTTEFNNFGFVNQDPLKVFTEVFSFMNEMNNMFSIVDTMLLQMQNVPISIHIIDLTNQQVRRPKIKIEDVTNKPNKKQLLLENKITNPVHIIDDKELDTIIANTLRQN